MDNPDEQAAQIRRELDGRLQMADQIARVRHFFSFTPLTKAKNYTLFKADLTYQKDFFFEQHGNNEHCNWLLYLKYRK